MIVYFNWCLLFACMEFLHCFFFLFYFFGGLLVGERFLLLPLFLLLHLPFVFPPFFFHLFLLIILFSFPLPFLSFPSF